MNRTEQLIKQFDNYNIEAMIISDRLNRRYLSGFTGSSGTLYISKTKKILVTDFRYIEQSSKECPDYEIVDILDKALIPTLNEIIKNDKVKNIGFEENIITHSEYKAMDKGLDGVTLVGVTNLVEDMRMIKSQDELDNLRKAVEIGDKAFSHILGYVQEGITELDIALELEFFMKKNGATNLSFDSIVASGVNSSMPHAQPSNKKIQKGDFLTLDFGCLYNGYCSDMTRTVVIGNCDEEQTKIYNTVLKAQEKALEMIRSGIFGFEADKVARDIIKEAGYGDYFGHGLGHAVGMYIHENPRLSVAGNTKLESNMVVTVEPGIYVPNFGGVRIEDMVVVKEDGIDNLTKSSKELIILD